MAIKLWLVGSCRGGEDDDRIEQLKKISRNLGLEVRDLYMRPLIHVGLTTEPFRLPSSLSSTRRTANFNLD